MVPATDQPASLMVWLEELIVWLAVRLLSVKMSFTVKICPLPLLVMNFSWS